MGKQSLLRKVAILALLLFASLSTESKTYAAVADLESSYPVASQDQGTRNLLRKRRFNKRKREVSTRRRKNGKKVLRQTNPPKGMMNMKPKGKMNMKPKGKMNMKPKGKMNMKPKGKMNMKPKVKKTKKPRTKMTSKPRMMRPKRKNFVRVSSFLVCSQIDIACNTDEETAAEIIRVFDDGAKLVYTDSPQGQIGFVDIADPTSPVGIGVLDVGGEPTSVVMKDNLALVAVNTSPDFVNPSGELKAVDVSNATAASVVKVWNLGGQPDSIDISPDGNYLCIAIENERDEDLGNGAPPQQPAGFVVVVDTSSDSLDEWVTFSVDLRGLDGVTYPDDPEPEFVHINSQNVCVVTLQENNAIVLIDLATKSVTKSFSAGAVDLEKVDINENDLIEQNNFLSAVPREPDGVVFIDDNTFATADEGDLDGGSRGYTIFNVNGEILYTSGSEMEHIVASVGHYPESRSENKGNEPENVAFGTFEGTDYLFVNSERSSLTFVYDIKDVTNPMFRQVLPVGKAPEGSVTIPQRNLLVVASEDDVRDDKIRSVINIFELVEGRPQYPTLRSNRDDTTGVPIPFGGLSGLAPVPDEPNMLYSFEDSFYKSNRFFHIDTEKKPARLVRATRIVDSNGVFAAIPVKDGNDDDQFTATDLEAMINDFGTVNIDSEGIVASADGEHVYIASEGSGTVGDSDRPIETLNFIFKVGVKDGVIDEVITLPDNVNAIQVRYGFEGLSLHNDYLIAAFQRAWGNETNPRLGMYNMITRDWKFVYYPLDAPESQNGGWVGVGDVTAIGQGQFLVLERDNQGGPDGVIKRIYKIDLGDDLSQIAADSTVTKVLVRDIVPDFLQTGGLLAEKIEGLALAGTGDVWVVNDNDGAKDSSGETQLLNLGNIL